MHRRLPVLGGAEAGLAKRRHFELLWQGKARGVETMPFPEAAKRELIRKYHEGGDANGPRCAEGRRRAAATPA